GNHPQSATQVRGWLVNNRHDKERRDAVARSVLRQEISLATDPTEQPVIGSDHQLPASIEPKPSKSTGVSVLVWLVVLAVFAAGFFLVMRHRDTTPKAAGGGGRRGGGPGAGGTVPITMD